MHDWTRLGTIGHDFGLRQGFGATRGRPQAAHRCPNPILAFFAIWIHKIKNLFLASSTFIHLDSPSFGFIDLHWGAAGFNAKAQGRKGAISAVDCGSLWHKMACAAADGRGAGLVRRFVFHGVIMLWLGVSHSEGNVKLNRRKCLARGEETDFTTDFTDGTDIKKGREQKLGKQKLRMKNFNRRTRGTRGRLGLGRRRERRKTGKIWAQPNRDLFCPQNHAE